MAIRDACELYIEQEIDSGLEEGKKPYAIGKDLSVWIEKLFEVKMNPKTIEKRAQRLENKNKTNVLNRKPMKKHTKKEVKLQLEDVAKYIKSADVADDDIKKLDLAISTVISNGTAAVRVGTATATAVKKATKKKGGTEPKPIDNFKKLNNCMKQAIDGLTLFAEGTMKPETEDEAEYAKAILAKAANFITQYARLGADIQGILYTFVEGETNDDNEKYNQLRKIN